MAIRFIPASLIILSREKNALEAVAVNLDIPFLLLAELGTLRTLSQFVLDWVAKEFESVATKIVRDTNATPFADRAAAPPFAIDLERRDQFAPEATGNAKRRR